MATIDVMMTVKNGMPFLNASIESVINQSFKDWRLIIVDHASTDSSLETAHRYAERDRRIDVHSAPASYTHTDVRNLALDKCDCRYAMCQDADDISVPLRMQTMDELFVANPRLVAAASQMITIDSEGSLLGTQTYPVDEREIAAAMFFYYPSPHPAAMINFSALDGVSIRYGQDFLKVLPQEQSLHLAGLAEDYFLFAQLSLLGPIRNIETPMIKYRIHSNSVTRSRQTEQRMAALEVSRFLSRTFSAMHDLETFDPVPFCSHSEHVYDCGKSDYSAEFDRMASVLRQGLGQSSELTRALRFRWVLATRHSPVMLARYLGVAARYGIRPWEYRQVRNWIFRSVNDSYVHKLSDRFASMN